MPTRESLVSGQIADHEAPTTVTNVKRLVIGAGPAPSMDPTMGARLSEPAAEGSSGTGAQVEPGRSAGAGGLGREGATAGPQQPGLLRGVVASHAMPAVVAAPGPQGTNDP
ncbi:hypothetical protein GCM10010350_82350 [Streptomyces galilaeus]|nr:hypothetical protein GCM10010350_82350 [Streptomyces galilaeus]